MPANKTQIYLLPEYTNKSNLKQTRYESEHESKIRFTDKNITLELSEINSLIEERYCLKIKSAKYVLEGMMSLNEIKEAMIHHHPHGHPWKHIQFKLESENEVIRINLEPVDEGDYVNCIKGFLHISQDLINLERDENKIETNLIEYFFDDNISELKSSRTYLLNKIRMAYEQGKVLNNSNKPIDSTKLKALKSEKRLLPFLNW